MHAGQHGHLLSFEIVNLSDVILNARAARVRNLLFSAGQGMLDEH